MLEHLAVKPAESTSVYGTWTSVICCIILYYSARGPCLHIDLTLLQGAACACMQSQASSITQGLETLTES